MSPPASHAAPEPGDWRYDVIRKAAMALSGLALAVFLLGHWHGNLVLLQGEAAFAAYLAWLDAHPLLHYGVWLVLVAGFTVHLAIGPRLWLRNRRARPLGYRRQRYRESSRLARGMMLSGGVLLLFVVVHVLHVRGWPPFADAGIYRNMQAGFASAPVVAIYLLGQLALAAHLYHGLWSQFQTLGLSHPRYDHWRQPLAAAVGLGIAALNSLLVLLNVPALRALWSGT